MLTFFIIGFLVLCVIGLFKLFSFLFYRQEFWIFMAYLSCIFAFLICCFILILIFEYIYYRSKKFYQIKTQISENTRKCNELNEHIESLKEAYINAQHVDFGESAYEYKSYFTRPNLSTIDYSDSIYRCSASVCRNAQAQPFKYFCKYFNVKENEVTLNSFEKIFNDFSAAEQGRTLLKNERNRIIDSLKGEIPSILARYRKNKLFLKLGFSKIDLIKVYFPKYSFKYLSPAGNSSLNCDIVFDINTLERFIIYLSQKVKFRKSIAGQRSLMTSKLREEIKSRDNYACRFCGVSVREEPNLLLEIDHVIPLSKGGMTSEDNLQTLCWRCNRSKGNKLEIPQRGDNVKI